MGELVKASNNMQAYLAKAASEAMGNAGTSYISLTGGMMSIKGIPVPGNSIKGVILSSVFKNALYTTPYNPSVITPPDCFAVAVKMDDLAPHPQAEKPAHKSCNGCPNNEWGSKGGGSKAKKCRNIRVLAILPVVDGAGYSEDVVYLKIPVTSCKNFATYSNKCAIVMGRPPFGVITKISLSPNMKTQYEVKFDVVEQVLDSVLLEHVIPKIDVARNVLLQGAESEVPF